MLSNLFTTIKRTFTDGFEPKQVDALQAVNKNGDVLVKSAVADALYQFCRQEVTRLTTSHDHRTVLRDAFLLLWTELEEKGYCSYARDMITGFVNAIVFKEKILGYAGDTYLAIERQYPPQQLLNSFNPWHAHVETNFVMLPVPNEPLANARYTRRDENAVHAVAAMNSWVRNVR